MAVVTSGCADGIAPERASAPAGPISVHVDDLDFGRIWQGTTAQRQLRIRNNSDETITITRFRTSCGCAGVTPPSVAIPAKTEQIVSLEISLPTYNTIGDGTPYSLTIIPEIDSPTANALKWIAAAHVDQLLLWSPSSMWFDAPLESHSIHRSRKVAVTSSIPLSSLDVSGCDELATLDLLQKSNSSYELAVRLRNDIARFKRFRDQIKFKAQLPTGEIVEIGGPIIAGRVPADVEPSISEVDLGVVRVGDIIERHFSLRTTDGKAMSAIYCRPSSNDTSARVVSSKTNSAVLLVSQRIGQLGNQSRLLCIDVELGKPKRNRIEIPITFVGIR
jgi:hypothetical protein